MLALNIPPETFESQVKYAYDPVAWAWDMVGWKADKWQAEALEDLMMHRFIALSTGTGVGKSSLLAILILFFLSTRPFPKIPCTAPSQHQLFDILWAEIAKWQIKSEFLRNTFKWTQTKVVFKPHPENWFAVARTSRPQPGQQSAVGLQGFHADNILMIVDEASGVPDQVLNAVDGAITTKGAYVVLAGNPIRRSGYFFRTISDKRLSVENGGSWKIKHVDCRDAKYCDPIHIKRAIEIYGESSDFFRVKVRGLPPLSESTSLISPEQVFEAHDREVSDEGVGVLSCDPARYGGDSTVYYYRRGKELLERQSVRSMDTMQVTKIGLDMFYKYDPQFYCIDVIGIGSGVVDRTKEILAENMMASRVIAVGVGEMASDPKTFYNLRAELYWFASTFIDQMSIPIDTDLLDEELASITYGWDQRDARIKIQSKDEIRKDLGRSPNDADAFVIGLMPEIKAYRQLKVSDEYFKIGSHDQHVRQEQGNFAAHSTSLSSSVDRPARDSMDFVGSRRYGPLRSGSF